MFSYMTCNDAKNVLIRMVFEFKFSKMFWAKLAFCLEAASD